MVGTCGLFPGSVPVKGGEKEPGSSASMAVRVEWVSGRPVGRILYTARKNGATEKKAGISNATGHCSKDSEGRGWPLISRSVLREKLEKGGHVCKTTVGRVRDCLLRRPKTVRQQSRPCGRHDSAVAPAHVRVRIFSSRLSPPGVGTGILKEVTPDRKSRPRLTVLPRGFICRKQLLFLK